MTPKIIPAALIAAMLATPAYAASGDLPCPMAFDPRLDGTMKAMEIAWLRGFDTGVVVSKGVYKCRDGDVTCHANREADYFALVKSLCRRHPEESLGEAAGGAEGILDLSDKGPSLGPMDVEGLLDGIEQSSKRSETK